MRIPFATVLASMFIAVSAAFAQTTPSAPATGAPAGGIGDWWWVFPVVLVVAVAA